MSGTSKAETSSPDSRALWAALDSKNERLIDASHPLLADLRRDRRDRDDSDQVLPAAS
jgi:hypothetical protein